MLADTQAAHFLGGFKVGVGFALRRCRNCLATKDTMSIKVKFAIIFCNSSTLKYSSKRVTLF